MLRQMHSVLRGLRRDRKGNAPLEASLRGLRGDRGVDPGWQQTAYGEYYARSADVFAAVKLRAESVSRPPLRLWERDPQGTLRPVAAGHPAQRLLERVNPWWSLTDLLVATETYLCLWGSAFWYLARGPEGELTELWALRPDRVRTVRETGRYVAGFVYGDLGREFPMLPEEVVWFRYFNPLDELAGFAPMGAARLAVEMGADALRFNREFFRNGANPQA